jgi:hypothetical protein
MDAGYEDFGLKDLLNYVRTGRSHYLTLVLALNSCTTIVSGYLFYASAEKGDISSAMTSGAFCALGVGASILGIRTLAPRARQSDLERTISERS